MHSFRSVSIDTASGLQPPECPVFRESAVAAGCVAAPAPMVWVLGYLHYCKRREGVRKVLGIRLSWAGERKSRKLPTAGHVIPRLILAVRCRCQWASVTGRQAISTLLPVQLLNPSPLSSATSQIHLQATHSYLISRAEQSKAKQPKLINQSPTPSLLVVLPTY